jgi:hypothetical protein
MTTSLIFAWSLVVGVATVGIGLVVLLVLLLRGSPRPNADG